MKRLIILVCLGMLLMGGLPSRSKAQNAPSDAPYIYYYSDILNAFVIERADGTDSRTIGDGLIPEDTNTISGPGWSPSGEWFAWTSAWVTGYGQVDRGYQPVAVHVSGERYVTTLDDIHDARMAWHPTEDLLFVAGVTTQTDYADFDTENVRIRLAIIDPSTDSAVNSIVTARSAISSSYQEAVPLIQWVDEDHAVAFYDEKVSQEPYEIRTTVHILDRSGNSTTRSIPYASRTAGGWHPTVSPAGYVAYIESPDNEVVVFENVITGEKHYDGQGIIDVWEMWWNDDGVSGNAYAVSSICDEPPCTVESWTFTVENGFVRPELPQTPAVGHLSSVTVQCDDPTHQFATWLTRAEDDNSIQMVHVYACSGYELVGRYELGEVIWDIDISPDGRYLSYVNEHIVVYDTQTLKQTNIAPDGRGFSSVGGGSTLWHHHLSWFFTTESASIAGGGGGPHWIGVATPDGGVNRDLTLCGILEPCIGWLPDRVDRSLLSGGQLSSVLAEPDRIIRSSEWSFYLSWSPDGKRLVSGKEYFGEGTRDTIIFDVATGQSLGTMPPMEFWDVIEWVQDLDETYIPTIATRRSDLPQIGRWTWAVSSDERYAAVELEDRSGVVLYDIVAETPLIELGHAGYPLAVFSPDNHYVIFSGVYQRLQIWDVGSGKIVAQLNTNATALAFSPNGQTLAVASSWDIQLWDVPTLLQNPTESNED